MKAKKWFPFYVQPFLSSRWVNHMLAVAPECVAYYTVLLAYSWENGALPNDMEELAAVCLTDVEGFSRAWKHLEKKFELGDDGWTNPKLERVRAEQQAKHERYVRAGRRGGKRKAASKRSDARENPSDASPTASDAREKASDAIAMPERCSSDALAKGKQLDSREVEEDSSSLRSEEGTPSLRSGALVESEDAEPAERVGAHQLVAAWVDRQRSPPTQAERKKQAGAAKRLSVNHDREALVRAWVGMDQLFPHSDGEPWDLYDLERKFSKAREAASKHPDIRKRSREEELLRQIGGAA